MGFFSKLFGGNNGKKPDPAPEVELPVKKIVLKGSAFFELEDPEEEKAWERRRRWRKLSLEKSFDEEWEREEPLQVSAEYEAEVEYVVLDEALLAEGIGEDSEETAMNEVFYVVISEHNSVTDEVIEGDTEAYEQLLFEELNFAIEDWGLRVKRFKLLSLVPKED